MMRRERPARKAGAHAAGDQKARDDGEQAREAGGAFTLFGGYIVGRHIELVPNRRIVQAWHEESWPEGVYSIVRFELTEQGKGTKLVFDHTGFPAGAGEHLAAGWKLNYWEPIGKFLG